MAGTTLRSQLSGFIYSVMSIYFGNIFEESLGCRREDFIFANYEGRDVRFLDTMSAATCLQALLGKHTKQWPESALWLYSQHRG